MWEGGEGVLLGEVKYMHAHSVAEHPSELLSEHS